MGLQWGDRSWLEYHFPDPKLTQDPCLFPAVLPLCTYSLPRPALGHTVSSLRAQAALSWLIIPIAPLPRQSLAPSRHPRNRCRFLSSFESEYVGFPPVFRTLHYRSDHFPRSINGLGKYNFNSSLMCLQVDIISYLKI